MLSQLNPKNTKLILSVDGGGIRGIIPAIILAELEYRTKKPISKIFDLLVGTSTGGILVSGLGIKGTMGNPRYSASDMVELYQKTGPRIFDPTWLKKSVTCWFKGSQYPSKNIETVLDEYFGNSTIADASTNLLLTSYDLRNNSPFFFKSWKEGHIKLKDALRAATAAPTFFNPKALKIGQIERVLLDGGVFANNPAVCAYASGKRIFPQKDIIILSIGTGRTNIGMKTESNNLGKIGWIKPLLHLMHESSLDVVNYQLDQVIGDKYFRIQSTMKKAAVDIDNVTSENIEALKQEASSTLVNNQKVFDTFCDIVNKFSEDKLSN